LTFFNETISIDIVRAEKEKPLNGSDVMTPRGISALNEVKRLRALLSNHSQANVSLLAQAKFEELDENRNGFLSSNELGKVVDWVLSVYRPNDVEISDAEKKRIKATMINRIDSNHDGKLDLHEFQQLFTEVTSTAELMNRAKMKFTELDTDHSGYLETHELDKLAEWVLDAYNPLGFTMEDKVALKTKLLVRIDSNQDGKLDLYEFSTVFQEVVAKSEVILKARSKFLELDDNKNGFIDGAELDNVTSWVIGAYHPCDSVVDEKQRLSTKEKLMRRIDINSDGKLDIKGMKGG
jgi:Ca2+-binding EF-hand superfamily protein